MPHGPSVRRIRWEPVARRLSASRPSNNLTDTRLHFIAQAVIREAGRPDSACACLTCGNFSDVPPLEASELEFIRAWLA